VSRIVKGDGSLGGSRKERQDRKPDRFRQGRGRLNPIQVLAPVIEEDREPAAGARRRLGLWRWARNGRWFSRPRRNRSRIRHREVEVERLDIKIDPETNGLRSKFLWVRHLSTTRSALDLEISEKSTVMASPATPRSAASSRRRASKGPLTPSPPRTSIQIAADKSSTATAIKAVTCHCPSFSLPFLRRLLDGIDHAAFSRS